MANMVQGAQIFRVTLQSVTYAHLIGARNANLRSIERVIHALALIIFPIIFLEFAIKRCMTPYPYVRRPQFPLIVDLQGLPGPDSAPEEAEIVEAINLVTKDPDVFHTLRHALRSNKEVVTAAVSQELMVLRYAGSELLNDRNFIRKLCLTVDPYAIYHASCEIKADRDFWFDVFIDKNPKFLVDRFEGAGALTRLKENSSFYELPTSLPILERFKSSTLDTPFLRDDLFIIDVVSKNCRALSSLAPNLWTDELVGLGYMNDPIVTLLIVNEKWRHFSLKGIQGRPGLFPLMPEDQKTLENSCAALQVNPLFLKAVPPRFLTYEMVLNAVRRDYRLVGFIYGNLENQDFLALENQDLLEEDSANSLVFEAIRQDPKAFSLINLERISETSRERILSRVIECHQDTDKKTALKEVLEPLARRLREGDRNLDVGYVQHLARLFNEDKTMLFHAVDIYAINLSAFAGPQPDGQADLPLCDDEKIARKALSIHPENERDYCTERVLELILKTPQEIR